MSQCAIMKANPPQPPIRWNVYVDHIEEGMALLLITSHRSGEKPEEEASSLHVPVAWLPPNTQENTWLAFHLQVGTPPSAPERLRTELGKDDDGKNFSL